MEPDGPTSLEPHRSHTCVSQLAHRSMRQTLLVYVFRKDIVETISNRAPRDDEGKDGYWWVEHPGLSDEEVRKHREKQRRVDRIAFIALGTISVGFVFQIVGSVASNLQ